MPTPTTTAVSSATITFSESVQNVTTADLTLNGVKLSTLAGVSIVAGATPDTYIIQGLSHFDTASKTYTLGFVSGNPIKDLAGNGMTIDPSVSWVKTH